MGGGRALGIHLLAKGALAWKSLGTTDVDGHLLAEELEALKTFLPTSVAKPQALFEYLVVNNRSTAFPDVFVAVRIYLTMPITVASGDRSFSKLKLIKTYLRSTISQERINCLVTLPKPLTLK